MLLLNHSECIVLYTVIRIIQYTSRPAPFLPFLLIVSWFMLASSTSNILYLTFPQTRYSKARLLSYPYECMCLRCCAIDLETRVPLARPLSIVVRASLSAS